MSDQQIDVKIIADSSGVAAGINEAVNKIRDGMKQTESAMSGAAEASKRATQDMAAAFESVKAKFAQGLKIDTSNLDAMKARAASVFEETRTASERMNSKLSELNTLFKSGAIDAETHARAVKQTESAMSGSKGAIDSLVGQLKGLALAYVGVQAAMGMATKVVETASAFEQLNIQLRGVMGSSAAGEQAFAWIKQFAVDTPYSVEQTTQAFVMMKNFGLDPMDGTLKKVSDAASMYGNGMESLTRITMQLGQAWGKGKLQAEDINVMVEAGVPVWDLLAKSTGKNVAELRDLSEKGKLGREAMSGLVDEMGKASDGMSTEKMNSMAGAFSNLGDAFASSIDGIRKQGGFNFLTESVKGLTEVVPQVVAVFADIGSAIGTVLSELWTIVSDTFGGIAQMLRDVFGAGSEPMSALDFFKNVLKVIQVAVIGFGTGLEVVFNQLKVGLALLGGAFVTFANVAERALHGDFSGAKAAMLKGIEDEKAIVRQGIDDLVEIGNKGRNKMDDVLLGTPKSARVADTEHKAPSGDTGTKKKGKAAPSRVGGWDVALQDEKIAFERKNELREMDKQAEVAYWQKIIAENTLSAKEKLEIHRKIDALELSDAKTKRKERDALARQQIDADRQIALDELAVKQQELSSQKALGQISAQEEITAKKKLEDEKFKIELKAAEDRAALLPKDSVEQKAAFAQIEALKRQHGLAMQKLNDEQAQAEVKSWQDRMQPINQAFGQSIQGIVMGTQTMQKALANIWQSIGLAFAQMATKMVTDWGAAQLAKLTASRAASATTMALDKVGQVSSTTAAIGAASVEVPAKAAGAAAGAASAVAPIPVVGPGMAMAAFASVMALVLGAKSIIPSAAGGFDIPSGVNPLTQLHEREMVLPAKYSDVIRGMAEGGGGSSGGPVSVSINAVDARSVSRLFDQNGGALVDALRSQARNFRKV